MRLKPINLCSLFAIGISRFVRMTCANMDMMIPLRERLDILLDANDINSYQHDHIVFDLVANDEILDAAMKDHNDHSSRPPLGRECKVRFIEWIEREMTADRLLPDTADLIINLFDLYLPPGISEIKSPIPNESVQARYNGNGIVNFFARSNFSSLSSGQIYNGIWGYETGDREYALQCTSDGLTILDVTTSNIVTIQTIAMSGGTIWRDVATHSHYAYVAAQNSGDAFVIDLQNLSSSTAQGPNSNPIPNEYIKNLGYENWGHTLNVAKGLLFLNSAGGGRGCKILDLEDPMNPTVLVSETGNLNSQSECHDSYLQTINNRDIFISSDGYGAKWRIYDITDIRTNSNLPQLSTTPNVAGRVYAHEAVVSDDGNTMFVFDEFNSFDIGVVDISDINNPSFIREFQWSEDSTSNSKVHNGFTRGKYLFVAYYEAGLRVFDISNVQSGITEVGHYETYRDPNGDGIFSNEVTGQYDGAWNVYVGFTSGKVLISDTKHGTFVVTVDSGTTSPPVVSPVFSPSASPFSPPVVSPVFSPSSGPTSSPVISPVFSPSNHPHVSPTTCSENPDSEFLFKKGKNGKQDRTKTCDWLSTKRKREKFCLKKVNVTPTLQAPQDVCRVTCESCDPNYENSRSKFFFGMRRNKPKYKSCSWLNGRAHAAEICMKNTGSHLGYRPPAEVCPRTCAKATTR